MGELAQEHVWYQASWTGHHYRPFGTFARVLVVHPAGLLIFVSQRLIYFDTTRTGNRLTLDDASIFPALGDAMKGTLSVRHSQNIIERVARVSTCRALAPKSRPDIGIVHQQQANCCREDGERTPMGYAEFLWGGHFSCVLGD